MSGLMSLAIFLIPPLCAAFAGRAIKRGDFGWAGYWIGLALMGVAAYATGRLL